MKLYGNYILIIYSFLKNWSSENKSNYIDVGIKATKKNLFLSVFC